MRLAEPAEDDAEHVVGVGRRADRRARVGAHPLLVHDDRRASGSRASRRPAAPGVPMKPWTNAVYVSLMRRRDSAAIVSNTSELLPDPDTPVKTVSCRFGMSRLMSRRLFSRAPRTWIAPQSAVGLPFVMSFPIGRFCRIHPLDRRVAPNSSGAATSKSWGFPRVVPDVLGWAVVYRGSVRLRTEYDRGMTRDRQGGAQQHAAPRHAPTGRPRNRRIAVPQHVHARRRRPGGAEAPDLRARPAAP